MEDGGRRPATSPKAWAQLVAGLFGYAVTIDLMIQSGIGLGPWDAFHVGLARQTGITVGTASILTGAAIVVAAPLYRVRPGPGTLANMVLVGLFVDLTLPWVPRAEGLAAGIAFYAVAIAVCGLSTGFYIAAGLGKGPRDGLMLGLSARTGWPVGRVRTLLELSVLGFGWWMGGQVGLGTLLFAFGIGPAVQWGLRVCGVDEGTPPPATVEP